MDTLRRESLIGSWQLLRWSIEYPDGRAPTEPFGADPVGLLLYCDDGWMTATMSRRVRASMDGATATSASPAARARVFSEYLSYGGRWSLRGSEVIHDVELSMNPGLIGTVQVRRAELDGVHLALVAEESDPASGRRRCHRIFWRRATPTSPQ
jgi:hypothetical protein